MHAQAHMQRQECTLMQIPTHAARLSALMHAHMLGKCR